jgi:hypothetical protein
MTRDTYDLFQDPERGRFGENELQHRPGHGPAVTGASNLVDLVLQLQQNRPLSLMVSDPTKPGSKWIPLPKSLIEFVEVGNGQVEITLPRHLAAEKGLI